MTKATTVKTLTRRGTVVARGLADIARGPVMFSLIGALVVGAIIIALTGESPLDGYAEMVRGAFVGSGPRSTLARSIPIIGMALALSIPFRAGVLNLGGEGQMVLGGLAGTLTAIYLDGPAWFVILLAAIVGASVGALWALIPALGQVKLAVPILITSLLLNWPARALSGYLVRFHFADPTVTSVSTERIDEAHRIWKLPIAGGVTATIILIIVLAIVIAVVNRRSVFGYETLMTGLNPSFARYGGIAIDRQRIYVMLASGAISGLVGTHLVVGETYRFVDGDLVLTGFAWTGLMVALLARNRPFAIAAAGLFFAAVQVGGLSMQRNIDVPWQLSLVLQAVIIVLLAAQLSFRKRHRSRDAVEASRTPDTEDEAAPGGGV